MFNKYFDEWEVRPEFQKEYVSLWGGWLGEESHKLDAVTEIEWGRFNEFVRLLVASFDVKLVDCASKSISAIANIDNVLSSYEDSMNKDSSLFSKYVLPELGCLLTEEWDYTYIVWHKDNGAVETLAPYIEKAGLKHFND